MPYNFAAYSFHTKKLCSRLSSSKVYFLMEIGHFVFLRPPLGDLGAMYDNRLRLIGKRAVDFLLALIELFTALHVMQTRYCDEISVCPSVRLSVTCVNFDKTVERSVQIYIPYERTFILVF